MKCPPWTALAAVAGLVLKKRSKAREVSRYSWHTLRKSRASNDLLIAKRIIDKVWLD
jgi:hypothetical protein